MARPNVDLCKELFEPLFLNAASTGSLPPNNWPSLGPQQRLRPWSELSARRIHQPERRPPARFISRPYQGSWSMLWRYVQLLPVGRATRVLKRFATCKLPAHVQDECSLPGKAIAPATLLQWFHHSIDHHRKLSLSIPLEVECGERRSFSLLFKGALQTASTIFSMVSFSL